MTKWLRVCAVLAEDKRLVPKHSCWAAHAGTPAALAPAVPEASGFLGHLRSITDEFIHTHIHTQRHTYINKIFN